jgi:hypothetical protein
MDELDADAAKRPLLFPDPVIEFYLEKVDRAAIRAQLGKTPTERLQSLVDQAAPHERQLSSRIREPETTAQLQPNESTKFAGFMIYTPDPDPAKRPLLFSDPVVEAYLKDVDRSILRENLKRSVAERLENFAGFMRGVYELRGAFYKVGVNHRQEQSVSHVGTVARN